MSKLGVAVFAVALLATSCGDNDNDSNDKSESKKDSPTKTAETSLGDVAVVEQGILDGYAFAFVENREDNEVAVNVEFTAFDSGDAEIDISHTQGTRVEIIPAASTTLIAASVVDDGIARITATLEPAKEAPPKHGPGEFQLTIDRFDLSSTPKMVYGTVTSTYTENVTDAVATLMCKDQNGERLTMSIGEFDATPGQPSEARFGINHEIDGVKSCDAYPRLSDDTQFAE